MLAVLGGLVAAAERKFLLIAWWVAIIVLEERAVGTYAAVPMSMLAGIGVTNVLLPIFVRASGDEPTARQSAPGVTERRPEITALSAWLPRLAVPVLVLGFLISYSVFSALTRNPDFGVDTRFLLSLSRDERAAMSWVGRETPRSSHFLVIPTGLWWGDRASEWFPVLAERVSVATVQGYEWLPDRAFARRSEWFDRVRRCADSTAECLVEWSTQAGTLFTHVYIPKAPANPCCQPLAASLREDPQFELVYEGAGATIFAWHPEQGTSLRAGAPQTPR